MSLAVGLEGGAAAGLLFGAVAAGEEGLDGGVVVAGSVAALGCAVSAACAATRAGGVAAGLVWAHAASDSAAMSHTGFMTSLHSSIGGRAEFLKLPYSRDSEEF